jgi:predicted lipid-binding transport protein (Tim44 family)
MSGSKSTPSTPQFQKAEYAGSPAGDRCKVCGQPVGTSYYRVNGAMTCSGCAEKAKHELPASSHTAYLRGLLFGIGAAIAGLVLYATFEIMTGLIIGYLSLAVGYMIGKTIKAGSRGLGGRKYQITAVLLTYAAVSMASIPVAISQIMKVRNAGKRQAMQATAPQAHSAQQEDQPPEQNSSSGKIDVGALAGPLLVAGLTSPFMSLQNPVSGIIGLVILLVGIRIAWQQTAGSPRTEIAGPFSDRVPTPAGLDAG